MMERQPDVVARYLAEIEKLRPLVGEHRASFDRDRRLPEVLARSMAKAGLFSLWLPRVMGGPELSPIDFMAAVEAASALDGSVGWLVGNGSGMSRSAGYLPPQIAREIFGGGETFVVSSTAVMGRATPVDVGYRVSGRWPFGSGTYHATWAMGLCTVMGGSVGAATPLELICCYMPMRSLRIIDTWHVSGMRGTGSADFEAEDVFVPSSGAHGFPLHQPHVDGLLYRLPNLSLFPWSVSTVPLGIARGALDDFKEIASGRVRLGSSTALREREIVQDAYGRAEAQLRAGRALLIDRMNALMSSVGTPEEFDARIGLRSACAFAGETAETICTRLAALAGSIAIYETHPLERRVRDVQAAIKHIAMNPSYFAVAGRVGLGLDPGVSRV